jgi:uncharacterized protein YbjT (DUF2867 family)
MAQRIATVIGATGLIGGHIIDLLKDDDFFDTIRIVSRKVPPEAHPGHELKIIDFSDQAAFRSAIEGSDAVFCAVGTTRKKVNGDMDAYRKVDHDIPVNAARYCSEAGCGRYLMVSSVGASSGSRNYYLRFKGEAENSIAAMGIRSVSVFRPSMLLGNRKEFRIAEKAAGLLFSPLSFLFPLKFRPVKARDVAGAMIAAAKKDETGFRVYHFTGMMQLIGKR